MCDQFIQAAWLLGISRLIKLWDMEGGFIIMSNKAGKAVMFLSMDLPCSTQEWISRYLVISSTKDTHYISVAGKTLHQGTLFIFIFWNLVKGRIERHDGPDLARRPPVNYHCSTLVFFFHSRISINSKIWCSNREAHFVVN